ncbi:MAG: Modification methylase [Hydrogenibacillus schlegelii]|uniref:site-specific DNA-methyltransferase (cytosine-N(4)-specific) n=1 Tax=Hydrogenibacillus schlegelii TaxID=1484 RepID=A0A2T5G6T6_HYDSH|nr:hypothetical protein [Hydrogenibacillus schlegelii]PTQ51894.1 MAG: Modification methylase [Hydrogenibacillus schlegelii]
MNRKETIALPDGFTYRSELRRHVTPWFLKKRPVHRWFFFPHSFSPELVDEILAAFPLPAGGRILDPFAGAGTTVLCAKERGYSAAGVDLSPLSVFVARAKTAGYDRTLLKEAFDHVRNYRPEPPPTDLPARLRRAFSEKELAHIHGLAGRIRELPAREGDFFRLALLRVQREISRAQPDGGWFRWIERDDQSERIPELFEEKVREQFADLSDLPPVETQIFRDDARILESLEGRFDLIITSPPYPNRHDYTRIFHIDLLALGLSEQEILDIRRRSLRSHVEARAPGIRADGYVAPESLERVLDRLPADTERRVIRFLSGYFEDLYLVLKALDRHLNANATLAFVVGNVRHGGVMVPVDEILVEIGQKAGYAFSGAWVARVRGNSAQQMGRFGREDARETIVFFRKN